MSGAVSFILGLLGLGTAGAVSTGEYVSYAKKKYELDDMYGRNERDPKIIEMRERVRKEWWSIPDNHPNCLGKWPFEYPTGAYAHSQERNWFKAHLEAKGIPYDDVILDQMSGVNGDKLRLKMLNDAVRGRKPRRRIF